MTLYLFLMYFFLKYWQIINQNINGYLFRYFSSKGKQRGPWREKEVFMHISWQPIHHCLRDKFSQYLNFVYFCSFFSFQHRYLISVMYFVPKPNIDLFSSLIAEIVFFCCFNVSEERFNHQPICFFHAFLLLCEICMCQE